ncbi:6-phosphogluconolactonase [Aureimonas sp. AU12]|uniref:6-phosphogluconolactonase n=1 Tax=Aureimonas sp. AU12 TaxID=1638161 RepID=UPI0007848160|nr:6-phosphogluconolactonase [Aureimonas sp. AU12]
MTLKRHDYATRGDLAEALAAGVAAVLCGGIATNGSAVLAVSGGSTPKLFLQTLARAEIDWAHVTVCLVDERWVPDTSPRSNAAFLRENFLQGPAAAAHLELFFEEGVTAEEAEPELTRRFGGLARPFDAVILGMGGDGHTASFFPGGDNLARALDLTSHEAVVAMRAPGASEPRVTLTLSRLADARFLALHIEGEEKRQTLDAALADGPAEALPVRAVLRLERNEPLQVFWAP